MTTWRDEVGNPCVAAIPKICEGRDSTRKGARQKTRRERIGTGWICLLLQTGGHDFLCRNCAESLIDRGKYDELVAELCRKRGRPHPLLPLW